MTAGNPDHKFNKALNGDLATLASALEETLNPNSPLASALDRELGDKLATVFGIDIVLEDHLIDLLGKPPS